MAIKLDHFSKLRPFLYHLTAKTNVSFIQKDRALKPSNILYAENKESHLRGVRRQGIHTLKDGRKVRDQGPLYAGKIAFSGGWTLKDLVLHLDDHVFFWPGWEDRPIPMGDNHFLRYLDEGPVILRIPTLDLFQANKSISPFFCKYNSGAPRCTYGNGSPRGPNIFLSASDFDVSPSCVREVTFKSVVNLPSTTQARLYPKGDWIELHNFH